MFIDCDSLDNMTALKREFGPKFKQFMLRMGAGSVEQAEEIIAAASD